MNDSIKNLMTDLRLSEEVSREPAHDAKADPKRAKEQVEEIQKAAKNGMRFNRSYGPGSGAYATIDAEKALELASSWELDISYSGKRCIVEIVDSASPAMDAKQQVSWQEAIDFLDKFIDMHSDSIAKLEKFWRSPKNKDIVQMLNRQGDIPGSRSHPAWSTSVNKASGELVELREKIKGYRDAKDF